MKNTVYHDYIQGIKQLDLSRELRFSDFKRKAILDTLGISSGMTVVDLGCGPGVLARKLASWLGNDSTIVGIDRDDIFIEHAQAESKAMGISNIDFKVGDVLNIPLENNSVDACISHTVIEHVSNLEFLKEQYRICRNGGIVSVMITLPSNTIKSNSMSSIVPTQEENELWALFNTYLDTIDEMYPIVNKFSGIDKLPELFELAGFTEIIVDAITLPVAIDDNRNSIEKKLQMINYGKQIAFENVDRLMKFSESLKDKSVHVGVNKNSSLIDTNVGFRLKELISERFEKRRQCILNNTKLWDFDIMVVYVVRGTAIKK